jgi:two-component system, OmpR family, response regulator
MKAYKANLVFIVENDTNKVNKISSELSDNHHFKFEFFSSSDECLANLHRKPIVVCVDYELDTYDTHERDGHKFLDEIAKAKLHTDVVFFSKRDDKELVREIIKWGAYDYVVITNDDYHRLENVLYNIEEKFIHHIESVKYKRILVISSVGVVVWIIVIILLQYFGMIKAHWSQW